MPASGTRPACHPVAVDRIGRIEVIAGPMFAGKTEELLRRVRRATIAGRHVTVVGHALDTRRGPDRVASHAGLEHPSVAVESLAEIETVVPGDAEIVAIDEAQFFGPGLVAIATRLAARGLIVIVAGLDVTFDGRPFEPLPSLMALAERVEKLTAICSACGEEAAFHVRLATSASAPDDVAPEHVGGAELYQARCRRHVAFD